jgi:hypothetical protein
MKDSSAVKLKTKNDLRPEKFPDGTNYRNPNMNLDFENGKAESGARQPKSKTNRPTETFRDGKQPKPQTVRDAVPVAGAHANAVHSQVYGSSSYPESNPKKRQTNSFGVGPKAQ